MSEIKTEVQKIKETLEASPFVRLGDFRSKIEGSFQNISFLVAPNPALFMANQLKTFMSNLHSYLNTSTYCPPYVCGNNFYFGYLRLGLKEIGKSEVTTKNSLEESIMTSDNEADKEIASFYTKTKTSSYSIIRETKIIVAPSIEIIKDILNKKLDYEGDTFSDISISLKNIMRYAPKPLDTFLSYFNHNPEVKK